MPLSNIFFGKHTREYEGFKPHIYKDARGFDTIGFGHKLTRDDKRTGRFNNLHFNNDAEARSYFKNIFNEEKAGTSKQFYDNYPSLKNAPQSARVAFEDMAYNMGPKFLDKFTKAKRAALNGDYETVGHEMVRGSKRGTFSSYAHQVGQRAFDNADRLIIASGKGRHYGDGFNDIMRGRLPETAMKNGGLGLRDTATSVAANMQAQNTHNIQQARQVANKNAGQAYLANNAIPNAQPTEPREPTEYAQNKGVGLGLRGFKWMHNKGKLGV